MGMLKMRICELYGTPPMAQALHRSNGGEVLEDDEPLACEDADVLYLEVETGDVLAMVIPIMAPVGQGLEGHDDMPEMNPEHMAEVAGAIASAFGQAVQIQQALQSIELKLTVVDIERDRRCQACVTAASTPYDVLAIAMVELHLQSEEEGFGLEFAGEPLPLHVPLHMVGASDGDTLFLTRQSTGDNVVVISDAED